LGLDWLWEDCRNLLAQFFAPESCYERVLTFLRDYNPHEIRFHPAPQYILAFGRSIYQLGIRGVVGTRHVVLIEMKYGNQVKI
jgi:hypothetical protein